MFTEENEGFQNALCSGDWFIVLGRTAKTVLSENADVVAGSTAGAIEPCAQDSKKPGIANTSFDIRF